MPKRDLGKDEFKDGSRRILRKEWVRKTRDTTAFAWEAMQTCCDNHCNSIVLTMSSKMPFPYKGNLSQETCRKEGTCNECHVWTRMKDEPILRAKSFPEELEQRI